MRHFQTHRMSFQNRSNYTEWTTGNLQHRCRTKSQTSHLSYEMQRCLLMGPTTRHSIGRLVEKRSCNLITLILLLHRNRNLRNTNHGARYCWCTQLGSFVTVTLTNGWLASSSIVASVLSIIPVLLHLQFEYSNETSSLPWISITETQTCPITLATDISWKKCLLRIEQDKSIQRNYIYHE